MIALKDLAPGYYWIKVNGKWMIANWTPYSIEGHGSFWTCGDECDIEINESYTLERRGIEDIKENRIPEPE